MTLDPNAVILIAGGAGDMQLERLARRAEQRGIRLRRLLHSREDAPLLTWDPETGTLSDDSGPINVTAAFVRQDVFKYLRSKQPADQADARAWKILIDGWLWSNPAIRMFNRGFQMRDQVNKPLALVWARDCGLAVPRTTFTTSKATAAAWAEQGPGIYKPIGGGDLCRPLERAAIDKLQTSHLQRPYIIQERLEQPEMRIFRVGTRLFGFNVTSKALDYRAEGSNVAVSPCEVPEALAEPLMRLTDRIGLSYTAADFKTCPETGDLKFLETNSNPMFAAFDTASEGALCDGMLDYLTQSD